MKRMAAVAALTALALATIVCAPTVQYTDAATGNVASIDGVGYATLTEAIESAAEGSEITLLRDVNESAIIDRSIAVIGNGFIINGHLQLKDGTLTDAVIMNSTDDNVLTIGNTDTGKIIAMQDVTVKYPLVNGTRSFVLAGNNADITISGCLFTNDAWNSSTLDAQEYSYGLYMNHQGVNGSFKFIDNEFNGAFRTMLPSINGTVEIENSRFYNSVDTVSPGPGTGSGSEATCITTEKSTPGKFIIAGNTFVNAGAFYFQKTENVVVENNEFTYEDGRDAHYFQIAGGAGHNLDLTKNSFNMHEKTFISITIEAAQLILPAGMPTVNYWAWADTESTSRPTDYFSYIFCYNGAGTRTFLPESDAALEAFMKSVSGNIGFKDGDSIKIVNGVFTTDPSGYVPDGYKVIKSDGEYKVVKNNASGNIIVDGDEETTVIVSGEETVEFAQPSGKPIIIQVTIPGEKAVVNIQAAPANVPAGLFGAAAFEVAVDADSFKGVFSLPFEVPYGKVAAVKSYENGVLVDVHEVVSQNGGYVTFVTDHTTTFVISLVDGPFTPSDDDEFIPPVIPSDNGEGDTDYVSVVAAASVVAILAALIVMIERKR